MEILRPWLIQQYHNNHDWFGHGPGVCISEHSRRVQDLQWATWNRLKETKPLKFTGWFKIYTLIYKADYSQDILGKTNPTQVKRLRVPSLIYYTWYNSILYYDSVVLPQYSNKEGNIIWSPETDDRQIKKIYIYTYLIYNPADTVEHRGKDGLFNTWFQVNITAILKEINLDPYLTQYTKSIP